MFQPLARNVAAHRIISRHAFRAYPRTSLVAHRLQPPLVLSLAVPRSFATSPLPPSTEKTTPLTSTGPLPSTTRKSTTDFRPAPRKSKPSTFSSTHVPTKPSSASSSSIDALSKISLSSAKETAVKDVEDAENHGVLTPPPPGANWFKRTLHKGIQLAVGDIGSLFTRTLNRFSSEILLSWREVDFHTKTRYRRHPSPYT